jgi:hypothetical protein
MAVYFERSTYSGAEPITLSEAKAFLRVDSSDDDSYITELITMTRDFIEKETNTALVSNTYTEYRNGFPSKENGVITLQINGDLTIGSLTPQVAFLKDGVWTNLHDGTELIKNGDFEEQSSEKVTNGEFALGSEQVTKGDFEGITQAENTTGTDWTTGTGWSIGGGAASCDGTNGARLNQSVLFQASKSYRFTIEVSDYTSGSIGFQYHNGSYVTFGSVADGISTVEFTPTGTPNGYLYIRSTNFIGSITNISVKEVAPGWTLGDGWSIDDEKAACDGTQSAESNLYQETVVEVAKTYLVTYTVTRSAGSVRVKVGSTGTGTYRDAAGTYTETITAAGDTTFYINADADFIGTVDTITVKELDPYDYWTPGAGWTIDVDKVTQTGSTSYLSYDSFTPNIGTKYEVVYTVSEYTSGSTSIDFAGSSLVLTESSLGTFTYDILATTTDKFQIKSIDFVGAINSISIIPFTEDFFSSEFNGLPRIEPNGGWDVTPDDRLNSVKIIYTAGPPEAGVIAPPLKQAMYLLLAHYYDNRSAVSFGNPKELPLGYKRIINNYKNPIWS